MFLAMNYRVSNSECKLGDKGSYLKVRSSDTKNQENKIKYTMIKFAPASTSPLQTNNGGNWWLKFKHVLAVELLWVLMLV